MHRTASLILSALLFTATTACATKVMSPTEAPALGSDATIVVKKNKTGTFAVTVSIANLAPAGRLDEGATSFVVWLVTGDQAPVRAGVLAYDEGDRRGALEASSPVSSFTVLVTLEKEASPPGPNGKAILRAPVAAR